MVKPKNRDVVRRDSKYGTILNEVNARGQPGSGAVVNKRINRGP
jgi:hypothetical protein